MDEINEALQRVNESQAKVIEASTELQSFLATGPYIDLGFECCVSAGEIVAIKPWSPDDWNNLGIEFLVYDRRLIHTAVRLRDSALWYPSTLTYKELRNRIRKAAKTDEVFI